MKGSTSCSPPSTRGASPNSTASSFALGIRHVGETTAAMFAKAFGTFEAFRETARGGGQGDAEAQAR